MDRTAADTKLLCILAIMTTVSACDIGPAKPPYGKGVSLQRNVHYVSSRRWKSQGLEWLRQDGEAIVLTKQPFKTITGDVTILIHGYNAPDRSVARYFKGLISDLRSAAADRYSMLVYDWPSRTEHWNELSAWQRFAIGQDTGARNPVYSFELSQYNGDSVFAQTEGAPGLLALLAVLAKGSKNRNIDIIGHSMGCLVLATAMKRAPRQFSSVRNVFWLAPDLKNNALEDAELHKGIAQIDRLHVLYSRNDQVLKKISAVLHFSGMLGADGPEKPDRVPANVVLRDLTTSLGTRDVHSRYMERGNPAATIIARELKK